MMKNNLHLFLLSIFTIIFNPSYSQNNLIGSWTGEDQGQVGTMEFTSEGYVSFITNGEIIGGKEYITSGKKYKMTYEINKSGKYSKIDFIITDLETNQEVGRMLGIFQMKGKNKLVLRVNFGDGPRPVNFKPKDNRETIVMTRN